MLILLVGCESSYTECKYDCIDICMEGKEYKKVGWFEPMSRYERATDECVLECYDGCRGID